MSAPSSPTPWRALAWALLPPLAVLLLRAALQGAQGDADASLQALRPATLVDSAGQALWVAARPFVLTVLGAAALIASARLALRRWGWPRLRPWALALWLLLCLGAAAALAASHANRAGRQPLPEQTATVLLAGQVAPSARGPGGAEVYVQPPDGAAPLRLHAPGQRASDLPAGTPVRLHVQAGRWWGRWATLTPATPAPPAAPASAPAPGADNQTP